ncbi:MAG: RagB/SusD family nutrient uptake outer membrane protein [Prevotella sp.]|nr:RagB/SusD family nutrient uptake outer membrane protein [Prevotella sp.]
MKKIIYLILSVFALSFIGCDDSVLDRLTKTSYIDADANFWRDETDLRMYCNEYYPQYFTGYNSGFSLPWTVLRGYTRSDDFAQAGTQANFTSTTPTSGVISTILQGADWRTEWQGQMWNFAWIRKSNILLDRIDKVTKPNITAEAYNHWTGIARFFRAYEYYRLVISFGDVPYFDAPVDSGDLPNMYRDRDPRGEVMDKVYDDLVYAIANVRENDGALMVNKYVVAAVASNIMLFEGSWEKYHSMDQTRAKKYLELAVSAADVVMGNSNYAFTSTFHALFGSYGLAGNKEVIMYRHYDQAKLRHSIASYSNGIELQDIACNLELVKSFICNDGKPYQNSTVTDANKFDVATLAKTRDPRFESTFFDVVRDQSSTMIYANKFIDRKGTTYINIAGSPPPEYGSNTNYNDAPCVRLAEVVLNWIEAKQILAENFSGAAVTQGDLDKSINAIRNRPLDAEAIAKGVKKTDPLQLTALPNDPARDADVSPLMWEIRRERRMEFVFEHTRLLDIKRWGKILDYMDNTKYPDSMFGPWVDFPAEFPEALTGVKATANKNVLKVRKADGTIVTFDGTNGADMVGFFQVKNAKARNAFGSEVYLSPVPKNLIQDYIDHGFTLTQTPGWENK